MTRIPMGGYYVWHCDWCDSTNYTLWSHSETNRPACSACHQHSGATVTKSTGHHRYPAPDNRQNTFTGIAC